MFYVLWAKHEHIHSSLLGFQVVVEKKSNNLIWFEEQFLHDIHFPKIYFYQMCL